MKTESASCPICHGLFPNATLTHHANLCIDSIANQKNDGNKDSDGIDDIPSPPPSSSSSQSHSDSNSGPQQQQAPFEIEHVTTNSTKHPPPLQQKETSIAQWLKPIGLSKYVSGLLHAGYRTTRDMYNRPPTDNDLRDTCGVIAMGSRRKLLSALSSLVSDKVALTRTYSSSHPSSSSAAPNEKPKKGEEIDVSSTALTKSKRKLWAIFEPGYCALTNSPPKRPRASSSSNKSTDNNTKSNSKYERPNINQRPRFHSPSQRVPGTSFTVDSFYPAGTDPGCTTYFLTHFHSDHYGGLRKKTFPTKSRVICTEITSRLLQSQLRIPQNLIRVIPLSTQTDFPDVGRGANQGASVWAFGANHCPGAVILLFYVWGTKRYVLHSGDCRFDEQIFNQHEKLKQVLHSNMLDFLHLDTTYCNPRYTFPPQRTILQQAVEISQREDKRTLKRCLFFFGTYSIGKEKVFLSVAEALNLKIHASKRKRQILDSLDLGESYTKRIVDDPKHARVHVVSMRDLGPGKLTKYAARNGLNKDFIGRGLAVLFRPTGWSFNGTEDLPKASSRQSDQAIVCNLAYSEHSSFEELKRFVDWAKPARIVPTVNARSKEAADGLRKALGHVDKTLRAAEM